MKLLITGSTGFVGSRVVQLANKRRWNTIEVRRQCTSIESNCVVVSNISATTDWGEAFTGVDCIVHCAARVHQMQETEEDALAAYRDVNTYGTLNLAKQAAIAGVKRFVFLSTAKVHGEFTLPCAPFQPEVTQAPSDAYALSKYEAEIGLKKIADETGLEVVIIRPPLVYGPGVKANFLSLMKLANKGLPLPLGAINNKRSMVFVDNLVDLILHCCESEMANGNSFLVSDDMDVSVTYLLRTISQCMGKKNLLIPIPAPLITLCASALGKRNAALKLCGNLQLNINHTKRVLAWSPPVTFEQGVQMTVEHYKQSLSSQ